jgi:hypothetical protein
MGASHSKALAYHRNVMRTAGTTKPESTALITSTRSAGRTQLSMSKAVSHTLLSLTTHGRD